MPDPAAYFSWDAVVLDIGPYYVSQLVMMLGPVAEGVTARGIVGQEGRDYPVGVPTTVAAILGLSPGAQATLTLSLDAWQHSHPPLEIYGTLGTLALPDPNFFGGEPRVSVGKGPWESVPLGDRPWSEPNFELPFGTFANYRGAGVEDLVEAIAEDRPHRADGELAAHVLDVLERILDSVRNKTSAPRGRPSGSRRRPPATGPATARRTGCRARSSSTARSAGHAARDRARDLRARARRAPGRRRRAHARASRSTPRAPRCRPTTSRACSASGAHTLGALLADGWYRGQVGITRATDQWGTETAFLAQLELEHEDGSTTVVGTDEPGSWSATHILAADLIEGQREDRRLVRRQRDWQPVSVSERGYDALVASPAPPVRAVEELRPVRSRRCVPVCTSSTSARTSTDGCG